MSASTWTGKNSSPTPASRRLKKGRMCRENKAWKGYEVGDGGRRRGCTFGRVPVVCVARGGHARRRSVDDGACAAASRRGPETQAQAADCGQGLRRGLAATGAGQSGNGTKLICPHRKGRAQEALQDGRKPRRYKRRWIVERTLGWLGNFRRLLIRWKRHVHMYRAFMNVACLLITARQL